MSADTADDVPFDDALTSSPDSIPDTAGADQRAGRQAQQRRTPEPAMSIDELAARSGVSSRTIRYYQTEELLPPPERRGRRGVYRTSHLRRLQLVSSMQQQGRSLSEIRELLATLESAEGAKVDDLVELGGVLVTGWVDDERFRLGPGELAVLDPERAPGRPLVPWLVELGLAHRDEAGDVWLDNRAAFDGFRRVREAGAPIEPVVEAVVVIQRAMAALSTDLLNMFASVSIEQLGSTTDEVAAALELLRDLSREAVTRSFAHEMSLAIHAWLPQAVATVVGTGQADGTGRPDAPGAADTVGEVGRVSERG